MLFAKSSLFSFSFYLFFFSFSHRVYVVVASAAIKTLNYEMTAAFYIENEVTQKKEEETFLLWYLVTQSYFRHRIIQRLLFCIHFLSHSVSSLPHFWGRKKKWAAHDDKCTHKRSIFVENITQSWFFEESKSTLYWKAKKCNVTQINA